MTTTANLGLTLLAAAQSQKHVTMNEALVLLDATVQLSARSRTVTAPPGTLPDGARWIVPSGATGGFAGHDAALAVAQDGGLSFLTPRAGWLVWVEDEAIQLVFDGTHWVIPPGVASGGDLALAHFAVGTAIDAGNPLSVKANNLLLAARGVSEGGSGDLRMKIDKEASGNTASQLYQTGFSGRAETGLLGNDHFAVKVSADGMIWRTALDIDPATATTAPGLDNAYALGSASLRFSAVYVANGAIQTSDARDKIDRGVISPDIALGLLERIEPRLFAWKVGGNGAEGPRAGRRSHAGFFAQDWRAALAEAGLDCGVWGLDDVADPASRQWLRPDQQIPFLWAALKGVLARLAVLEADRA